MKTNPAYYSEKIRNSVYLDVLESLTQRQAEVYQIIIEFGPVSTEQIAEVMRVYPNFITGRIKELRDDLKLIEIAGETISTIGNKPAILYKAKEIDPQLTIKFGE